MKSIKKYSVTFVIFIISLTLTFDLFKSNKMMVTDDYFIHLTTIAQFYKGLMAGDFPVRWANDIANYGSAFPILSQQLTSYLGAALYFITSNVTMSGAWLFLLGAFFSNIFLYYFLKLYFKSLPSLGAVIFFNFSNYRIFNIYVRGALPEFFASIFLPLILIGIYRLSSKKEKIGILLIFFSFSLLSLTHPMMLVIYAPLILSYAVFVTLFKKTKIKIIAYGMISAIFGIFSASYYLIPLIIESKYFYYGQARFNFDQFLDSSNYLTDYWFNFNKDNIFFRPGLLRLGLFETASIIIVFLLFLIYRKNLHKRIKFVFLTWLISTCFFYIFMTLPLSKPVYVVFTFLQTIQFPWRMWSSLIFLTSIAIAFILERFSNKSVFFVLIITIIIFRYPKLHAQSYQSINEKNFFTNINNPHTVLMQSIWSGPSEKYEVKKQKAEIIAGHGKIVKANLKSSKRNYEIIAQTDIRMIDYTFYFPGWKVYVDKKLVEIQFQDPAYRGIITYNVPHGYHEIEVVFKNTRVRFLANIFTAASFVVSITVYLGLLLKSKKAKD